MEAPQLTKLTITYEVWLTPTELAVLEARIKAMNELSIHDGNRPDWDTTSEARAALLARLDDTLHREGA